MSHLLVAFNIMLLHPRALLQDPWARGYIREPAMAHLRRQVLSLPVEAAAAEVAALRATARLAVQMLRKRRGRAASLRPLHRLLVLAAARCTAEVDERVGLRVARVLWRSWKHGRSLSQTELARLLQFVRGVASLLHEASIVLAGRGGARLLLRLGHLEAEARVAMWLVTVNWQGVAVSAAQLVARLRFLRPVGGGDGSAKRGALA
jgi:hypothetical protein